MNTIRMLDFVNTTMRENAEIAGCSSIKSYLDHIERGNNPVVIKGILASARTYGIRARSITQLRKVLGCSGEK